MVHSPGDREFAVLVLPVLVILLYFAIFSLLSNMTRLHVMGPSYLLFQRGQNFIYVDY